MKADYKVAVIGLGYVGLPIAVASAKQYPTIGFDINKERISELGRGEDRTKEVASKDLLGTKNLTFTGTSEDLANANFYIVTVPTPVDQNRKPDLSPLIQASNTIATYLRVGDIVVYESTVFPGCTEEICVPILEQGCGLTFNRDFFCGYSPERINPGDKEHTLETILKVTSGSNPETAKKVDHFYSTITKAGTYLAPSIRIAEAAKVIENSQRDINIAFVNELSLIFDRMGIDTQEVLKAAGTKWNFLKFYPGLVGGHCIGVDPYYLTYKAEELGYHPEVILAGRRINDQMGVYVANQVVKLMAGKHVLKPNVRVLILGFTFKENCPDVRNTKVVDIYRELKEFQIHVDVFDPNAQADEVFHEYAIQTIGAPDFGTYSAVVLAVAHRQFLDYPWEEIRKKVPVIFDVKGILPVSLVDSRL